MSNYLSAIALLLLVLSPLFVPVAVTVAPLAFSRSPSHRPSLRPLRPAPRSA